MPRQTADKITQGAMMVQAAAGNIPVIINAFQASPTAEPKVDVTFLSSIDPAKVKGYRVDEARGVVYPILAGSGRHNRSSAPYLSGLGYAGANPAFVGGWWSVVKHGVSVAARKVRAVASKVRHPIRTVRRVRLRRAINRKFTSGQWTQIIEGSGKADSPLRHKGFLDDISDEDFRELVAQAGQAGFLPQGIQALANQQLEAGDIDGAVETVQTYDPTRFGQKTSDIPAWVLPVAIGGGLLLLTQLKKKGKRKR